MQTLAPMEAKLVETLPVGDGWQFEPKWDGFRCIAVREGDKVDLISKSGKALDRYFPEVVAMFRALQETDFILDGELMIPLGDGTSFKALQMRLHPAESRIRKLSAEAPARYMLFDMLAQGGDLLVHEPLAARRPAAERFYKRNRADSLLLSPATRDRDLATTWLAASGGMLDGVVAKRLDEPYRPGERAMMKIKQIRSADCVVGGFRYASGKAAVGSLLLGLFDEAGKLNHVGFCPPPEDRESLTRRLEEIAGPPGFTGDAPGGQSRWATERSSEWRPVRWDLIAEVKYDQVTGSRFRHATRFMRWRPDKAPKQCRIDQLAKAGSLFQIS